MKSFRAILHGGLRAKQPDMTVNDAGDLISSMGFEALGAAVGEALQRAMPAPEKGQSQGNAGASKGSRGAGRAR